tara:strand:+ start:94 stop:795 length:702 start_codon:yes stop_codon:yes gene_type:complete
MILIDTVYQRVLALANKEQRGYITPQEFNLFADQAQLEILEQYFYDINQANRLIGNDTEYSDMLNLLDEKLGVLKNNASIPNAVGNNLLPTDLYKLGSVYIEGNEVEPVNFNEYITLNKSPLTRPTYNLNGVKTPVYVMNRDRITIYWSGSCPSCSASITYIKKPATPYWGYVVIDEKAMYNPSTTTNFELHASEEAELVNRILGAAGITMKQPDLTQAAAQMEGTKQASEKQ